jgi:protein-arginine kinase activator protein McsA
MEAPAQFMEEIVCPTCGQEDHATWESPPEGASLRHLATLSDGFKMWPAREGEDPKLTCKQCGTTQPDQKSVGA